MIRMPAIPGRQDSESIPNVAAMVVGLPFDLAAPHRGAAMAPRAIRDTGLVERLAALGLNVHDHGDLQVPDAPTADAPQLRNFAAVIEASHIGFGAALSATRDGGVGLFLGGDHSIAIGTIAGVAAGLSERSERLGLIWFDAHGDFNTAQTTLSGNLHGMPFAIALGYGATELTELGGFFPKVRPENAVLVGAREFDPKEREHMESAGVTIFGMEDIKAQGMPSVMTKALAIASSGTAGIHVSFDVDVMDPSEVPGTGYAVADGMTLSQAREALELIAASGHLLSLDMVELDPLLDVKNQSARVAVELIAAVFSRNTPRDASSLS